MFARSRRIESTDHSGRRSSSQWMELGRVRDTQQYKINGIPMHSRQFARPATAAATSKTAMSKWAIAPSSPSTHTNLDVYFNLKYFSSCRRLALCARDYLCRMHVEVFFFFFVQRNAYFMESDTVCRVRARVCCAHGMRVSFLFYVCCGYFAYYTISILKS